MSSSPPSPFPLAMRPASASEPEIPFTMSPAPTRAASPAPVVATELMASHPPRTPSPNAITHTTSNDAPKVDYGLSNFLARALYSSTVVHRLNALDTSIVALRRSCQNQRELRRATGTWRTIVEAAREVLAKEMVCPQCGRGHRQKPLVNTGRQLLCDISHEDANNHHAKSTSSSSASLIFTNSMPG